MKINLLIPDPYCMSSYYIINGLRHLCDKIIVVIPKTNNFSRILAISANSKYVKKIYYSINPVDEWFDGDRGQSNTKKEEEYIKNIIDICKQERISLIYPSHDPLVCLFSKNLLRFKELGIDVPVLEYDKLISIIDKFKFFNLAKKEGIHCPETFVLDKKIDLENILAKISFPVIIKPRFGFGARGVRKCEDKDHLYLTYSALVPKYGKLIVQEFVPGDKMFFMSFYVDRNNDYEPGLCNYWKSKRPAMRVFQDMSLAFETTPPLVEPKLIGSFLKKINYVGYVPLQFKVDSRNSMPKLLEMCARIGNYSWIPIKLGINNPLYHYNMFKMRKADLVVYKKFEKAVFVSPVEDFFIFLIYIWCLFKKGLYGIFYGNLKNPFKGVPLFREIFEDYKNKYLFTKKYYHPSLTNFMKDPFVSISYWMQCLWRLLKEEYPTGFQQ